MNSKTMDGQTEIVPDLKYRGFMLKLSRQITAQDMAELKYMLASLIPDSKMETIDTALELFRYLEKILFVEPNNLIKLEKLFREMEKPKLYEMVTKFILTVEDTQTVPKIGMSRRLLRWFLILVRRH